MIYYAIDDQKNHFLFGKGFFSGPSGVYTIVQADADGWIEWKGGGCPVPEDASVNVKFNDAPDIVRIGLGTSYWWGDVVGGSGRITHYKPVCQPSTEQIESRQAEQVKEWRGPADGLPPVGTVCQVYIANRDVWTETEVKAHVDGLALFKNGTGGHFYGRTAEHYRPLPTARERWIEAAMEAAECYDSAPLIKQYFESIYDSGLAKIPE